MLESFNPKLRWALLWIETFCEFNSLGHDSELLLRTTYNNLHSFYFLLPLCIPHNTPSLQADPAQLKKWTRQHAVASGSSRPENVLSQYCFQRVHVYGLSRLHSLLECLETQELHWHFKPARTLGYEMSHKTHTIMRIFHPSFLHVDSSMFPCGSE